MHDSYELMNHAIWVSRPSVLRTAANKPLQLKLAQSLGLRTPRTLITNDPSRFREFVSLCEGNVVVKATGTGWVYSSQGDDLWFVLTNRLSEADLDNLDEGQVSPVTVQEEIPKAFEVRANVVGQECHAIRIESQRSEISQVDWRRYDVANTPYLPFQLPAEVESRCLRLCHILGLEFGAIDLIRKPDGEFVFLEVNGNGQFLWAEQLSGVEVSTALARLLAGIAAPLRSKEFEMKGGEANV